MNEDKTAVKPDIVGNATKLSELVFQKKQNY